jgi:hypothetical protein
MDVQKLIQQLQVLRDVPTALRMYVDKKDFGSAVLLYSNLQPLLQAHGHIGFLRPMSRDAHEIMKVLCTASLHNTAIFVHALHTKTET